MLGCASVRGCHVSELGPGSAAGPSGLTPRCERRRSQRAELRKTTSEARMAREASAISANASLESSVHRTAIQRIAPSQAKPLIAKRRRELNRAKSDRQVLLTVEAIVKWGRPSPPSVGLELSTCCPRQPPLGSRLGPSPDDGFCT